MYNKHILKNNLRIITVPMKETQAITLYLIVGAGSRFEKKAESGISHFLEHLFFKGTKKRPDALSISKELDSLGAVYNAFTAEEMTGFYIQAERSKFGRICDILFDMILYSKFSQKEIEKERGVILEELNMHRDTPMLYVFDLYKGLLYGETPLGRMTIGKDKTIKSVWQKNFLDFKNKHYLSSQIVIAASGGLDSKTEKILKQYGEKLVDKESAPPEMFLETQRSPRVLLFKKSTDQAHLVLGVKSIKRSSEERFAQELLNIILGTTMSSRLFTQLREKRGLCYHVSSDVWYFRDTGSFLVYAGVLIKKINEAIKLILTEFNDIKENGVKKEELYKAKENLAGKMALKMESSFNQASFYADQELLLSSILTREQEIARINKVTENDIKNLAKKIFQPERLNLSVIGPYEDEAQFEKLLKI